MESAYLFIEEGRHYGNVLVHCHKGISRSASFVMGYLMKKNDLTWDEALSFLQMSRPIVQPNESFLQQLKQYHPERVMGQDGPNQRLEDVVAGPQRSAARDNSAEPTVKRPRVENVLVAPATQEQQQTNRDDAGNVTSSNSDEGDGDTEQLPSSSLTLPTIVSESSITVSRTAGLMPDYEEGQTNQSVNGEIR